MTLGKKAFEQNMGIGENVENQGRFSPIILEQILCVLSQDFTNLNVTQLLIG